jgi:hypothetical protein
MSFTQWLIAAAIATPPFAANARDQQQDATPGSPNAPAAAFTYTSAYTDYRPAADSKTSPDKSWRAANASVTGAGHASMAAQPPVKEQSAQAAHAQHTGMRAGHDMAQEHEGAP